MAETSTTATTESIVVSNSIRIKHGAGAPGSGVLAPFELGYSTDRKSIYINDSGTLRRLATIDALALPEDDSGNSTYVKVPSLNSGRQISFGTDLNTLIEPGNYRYTGIPGPEDPQELINCPTTSLFSMEVGTLPNNPTYLWQKIRIWSTGYEYYRSYQPPPKDGSHTGYWRQWFGRGVNWTYEARDDEAGTDGTKTRLSPNAIVKVSTDTDKYPYFSYTATNSGAFYATDENAPAKFGILPIAQGGTGSGSGLAGAPNNAIIRRFYTKDDNGVVTNNQLYYTPTKSGAFYATETDGKADFGILPVPQGGLGRDFSTAPAYAIIRASSNFETRPYLYYTSTGNGAFYATTTNGEPKFGVLPVAQGGTYNSTLATADDGVIIVKRTDANGNPFLGTAAILAISRGGTGASDKIQAFSNLYIRGNNTVPAEDTPTAWNEMGAMQTYLNANSTVINKPTDYGTLINIPVSEKVHQIFFRQAHGHIWIRSGSSYGWYAGGVTVEAAEAWRRIYTSKDVLPVSAGGTDANTPAQACINLGALDIASLGKVIETSTNLNNIKTPGSYYCPNGETTETLSNQPFTGTLTGFKLIVIRSYAEERLIQIAINSTGVTYLRTINNSGWQDWRQIC